VAGTMAGTAVTTGFTTHGVPPLRVGSGALDEIGRVVTELGIGRALVITDPGVRAAGWADRVTAAISAAGAAATTWDGVRSNPGDLEVHACRDAVAAHRSDGLVAVGGGSTIDVAKATAGLVAAGGRLPDYAGLGRLTVAGPPVVAVPTTPGSGAEMSRHCVIADPATGRKYAVSGRWMAPRAIVVDPDTFATAPRDVLVDTVLDSLIHAIEAFLARAATPYTDLFSLRAAAAITRGLAALSDPDSDGSETTELVAGCLAASVAMAEANAGVIHAMGYPLTSEFGIPHGRANSLVAGAALRVVAKTAPQRCAQLSEVWTGASGLDLAGDFDELLDRLEVPRWLGGYGVTPDRLPELANLATDYQPVLRNAPVMLTEADLLGIYEDAWAAAGEESKL
jgi:alcohol dehydrogenase class IV